MKRILPFVIMALAIAAFWYRYDWLPPPAGQSAYLGYVEGETRLIGAPVAGRLVSRAVAEGDSVAAGAALFSLDTTIAAAELASAQAALTAAQASKDNLLTGKRAPEVALFEAQRAEAAASLELAEKELARARMLTSTGTAAQSRLDNAEADVTRYRMRVAEAQAAADTARLPARDMEIAAAKARSAEAAAAVEVARSKLADLAPTAPQAARVEDTFFDVGEWVAAGQPVVALLPPEALTLRFFVPETEIARAQPGSKVVFSCDACGAPRQAVITAVASVPEYTPPVIYSREERAKLVFRVEARPVSRDGLLPGLPIAVERLP